MITVSAFHSVPPFAQGLVRDLRVRWALEEVGLPYEPRLVGLGTDDLASAAYRRLQPFGQVPAYEEDGLTLFESGAIVLHIAEQSEALMPADPAGRARVRTWAFATLNTIEPPMMCLWHIDRHQAGEPGAEKPRAAALDMVKQRLAELSAWLGQRDYLEDRFTAGDLLMTTVLNMLRGTDLLTAIPSLEAYRQRCLARPAFQRALAAHMAPFRETAAAGE